MATKFLEPGGDADFQATATTGFWSGASGTAVATDFVHGAHIKSLKYNVNAVSTVQTVAGTIGTSGRISFYLYINALPSATSTIIVIQTSGAGVVGRIRMTSGGVLQVFEASVQIGTNGATLSTGTWYRICFAWKITSTAVNEFRVFVNGVSSISVTNATITNTAAVSTNQGNASGNLTLDIRTSDHYIDDSNSLLDTGDIWVTAKRPNANGTTNGFTTQIGSGGSGYGSGHSPQVNERALSNTNGWSMVGAGSAITEEYSIESKSTGDIDISKGTTLDFLGWVDAKSALSETASIVVAGSSSNIALTSTETLFTKIAGSATYPAGNTDIGIITSTTVTTVSLYEAGIIVAFIPAATINVSDSSAISDAPTISLPISAPTINVNDSTTVSDSAILSLTSYINVSDSSVIGESLTIRLISNISASDSSVVSDTGTLSLISNVNVSESTAISDTPTLSLTSNISVTDSTAVSDTITIYITTLFLSVTDATAVSDPGSLSFGAGASVSDTTAVTDTISLYITNLFISISDSTTVNDSITISEGALASKGFSFVVWID